MELLPFQKIGAQWLAGKKFALLADEMRLGKTPQVIHAIRAIGSCGPVLVICPAVARTNWVREFDKWMVSKGFIGAVFKLHERRTTYSVVVSYDYAIANADTLKLTHWDLIVIDEVHFLKSLSAKRSKSIFGREGLVHMSKRVWALSGTPAPNHAGELWILLFCFGATKLKYQDFLNRYCDLKHNGYSFQILGTKKKMIPELREILKKVMLRRLMKNVLPEIPPLTFTEVVVEAGKVDLTKELEQKIADEKYQLNDFLVKDLSSEEQLRMLEGLAESVSTLRRYSGLQKVEACVELVSMELESKLYEKVVVFATHHQVIEEIAKKLEVFNPVVLYGSMSSADKQAAQDQFQHTGKGSPKVFIGNILSAGTNITLNAADQIIFVEQDWVPGNNTQAARRCSHVLEKKPVNIRVLSLDNLMDEKITRVLTKKIKELSEIFD